MGIPGLLLPHKNVIELVQHAASCFPAEACGLLAGKDNRLLSVIPIKNVEKKITRFRMDPEEQIRAFQEIEKSGQELLAIYHSHPDGSSQLSQIDLDNFFYPGVFSVLIYLKNDNWNVKAYRINDEKKTDEIYLIFTDLS